MTRYSRKKGQSAPNRSIGRRCLKTKHYKKDVDQILDEVKRGINSPDKKRPYEMVEDLPAGGEYFCTECDRFFIDKTALSTHKKSKQHKQRVKELKTMPYSKEEAERAAGMGSYALPDTSISSSDMNDCQMKDNGKT